MNASSDEFNQAVDAHYERVHRLARVMSGNETDAADLAQETFLEALRGWASFQRRSSTATWLIGILRRRYLLSLRRKPSGPPPDDVPAPAPRGDDLTSDLHTALAALPESVRTPLFLFYFEHLDYATIAQMLDCPIGTVRSRLHDGRAQLRARLTPVLQESLR
ncbi:MAG: RNA polymerase sigma factor [Planctomycetota bacterium]